MNESANVIDIQNQLIIKEFGIEEITAANITLMEKQILAIPEKPETKAQYDDAYRFNVASKNLLPRIEERRKELKAPILEKGKAIDEAAKKAVSMVQPLIELSGSRRQAWEDKKAAEKAEKELAEKLRIGKIQWHMDGLTFDCELGLEYNTPSEVIFTALEIMKDIEISEADYQERTEEAKSKLAAAISATETALSNREKFEADQAEAARVKAEQEAEAKRLEEERSKLEADKKAHEAEKDRIEKDRIETVQNAFKLIPLTIKNKSDNPVDLNEYFKRLSTLAVNEDIFKDRFVEFTEFVENQLDAMVILQHGHAIKDHEQLNADMQVEIDTAHAAAIIENERRKAEAKAAQADFEAAQTEALVDHESWKERQRLVGLDKLRITSTVEFLDGWISNSSTPKFETESAITAYHVLITNIKTAIAIFEKEGEALR